jgi:hypothetical protein
LRVQRHSELVGGLAPPVAFLHQAQRGDARTSVQQFEQVHTGVWGSRTSALAPFGIWLRGVAVLVDQTTEDLRSPNRASRAGSLSCAAVDRRALLESAVWAVSGVVGVGVSPHVHELALVEDQYPVQALAAHGADPRFGVSVGLRRARRTGQHRDAGAREHGGEAGSELGITIAEEEPEPASPLPQISQEVTWPAGSPIPPSDAG